MTQFSRVTLSLSSRISPRFQGANLERNLDLVERVRAIADGPGVTVAQLAIAWVAAQGADIVPLVGRRRRRRTLQRLSGEAFG